MAKTKWVKLGNLSVDTATIMIACPHAVLARSEEDRRREEEHRLYFTPFTEDDLDSQYDGSSAFMFRAVGYSDPRHEDRRYVAGAAVKTGMDGTYPIYVQLSDDENKEVLAVVIAVVDDEEAREDLGIPLPYEDE